VTLQNQVQTAHWFKIAFNGSPITEGCLRFPEAAIKESRLHNEITMLARSTDNSIVVSGYHLRIEDHDIGSDDALNPGRGKTNQLKTLTAPYLNHDDLDVLDRDQTLSTGRAELSVGNDQAPIIDKIPASGLGLATMDESVDLHPDGVWLCYGFGRYGTVLAPGAARLLVSRMRGDGGDDTSFRKPPYERPAPEQLFGKGKGKANY
jgi:hypothetical protein